MNYKKPTFWIILIAIIICVTTVICFGTNPLKKAENPNPTETEATEQTENKDDSENKKTENTDNKNTENTDKGNTGTGSTIGKEDTAAEMIARHTTVLTGPVTQYVQVDNSRTVTYTDLSNQEIGIPVSLPKFLPFSDDAIACQAGLEKDLEFELRSVAEAVASKTGSAVFYINFEAWLNGDILSVVIRSEASYDYRTYYTYNFDVTTGKRLSREDLVQKLQITNLDGRLEQTAKNGFITQYGPVGDTDEFKLRQLSATVHSANLKAAQLYVGQDGKLMSVVYIHAIAGAAGYYERLPVSDESAENNPVILTHKVSFIRGDRSELTGAIDVGVGKLLNYESCKEFFESGVTYNSLTYSKEFFNDHSLLLLGVARGSGSAIMEVCEVQYKDGYVFCFLEYPTCNDVVMNADMAYWYCLVEVDQVLPEGTRVVFYGESVTYGIDAYYEKQKQFNSQRVS